MKHIISDQDVRVDFLRCSCDTKYDRSAFDLLVENGCRVCGHEFQRVTEAEVASHLARVADSISPETATFLAMLLKE